MTVLRTGHGLAALLAATGGHAFVRWEVTPDRAATWWQVDGAVAFLRTRRTNRQTINLLGDDVGVEALLDHLHEIADLVEGDDSGSRPSVRALSLSLAPHLEHLLHDRFRVGAGGDWEWFHTTTAPPDHPSQRLVRVLDDRARAVEVSAFLERHSPTADTPPAQGERWLAIENEDGSLAAVTAVGRTPVGAPHLSSVAVDSSVRGRGLGRTIVAAATRQAVLESGVCTLGMYSHNDVARGLYLSMGYELDCAWSSRAVMVPTADRRTPR
jgi:ribosomal protein S18 acetylase RimI-like enzyme